MFFTCPKIGQQKHLGSGFRIEVPWQCCQLLSLWSLVQNTAIFHDLPATQGTGLHQIFGGFVFFHLFHTNMEIRMCECKVIIACVVW